jgi:hypothetical protein
MSISLKASITYSMDASCGFGIEMAASSGYGTKRKCRNARVFPELGVDRLCHPAGGHGGP